MKLLLPQSESASFWLGVVMIAASFAIYPLYVVIAFLPVPLDARVAGAIIGSILSWAVFFTGALISGRRGVTYVKRWLTQNPASLKPPPMPPREPEED